MIDPMFSNWIRKNLPQSNTGLTVNDLDFVIYNYKTKKLMFIELKTFKAKVKYAQRCLFQILDKALRLNSKLIGIDYQGFHLITFEGNDFNKDVYFDHFLITEKELVEKLSI